MSSNLFLDRLRRMQQTLSRRASERDPTNIQSVGFAPVDAGKHSRTAVRLIPMPVVAQFDVLKKRKQVRAENRIGTHEPLRLLNRSTGRYDDIDLPTDVRQIGAVVPTGVRISVPRRNAVTAIVARWTTIQPVPPRPQLSDDVDDPRWRWGVLTVSHLFTATEQAASGQSARLQRRAVCGDGPTAVGGRVVARGRIPGGPDIGLVETGLERLWLSGFLPRVDMGKIATATEQDLIRWTSKGTSGDLFADNRMRSWDWQTYYPSLQIAGLGRLQHIIRYGLTDPNNRWVGQQAFGPGTSGGVLVAGGIPIGLQVAAMQPDYRIGYAQSFVASLRWLKKRLQASSLAIVRIVT